MGHGSGRAGDAPAPSLFFAHFCRIINNCFILPPSIHQDLKAHKTLIAWVYNESVGFSAFNFAVIVTNFVAAGSLNRGLTHLSFLQTNTDILVRHV